jgi:hypothetical protein
MTDVRAKSLASVFLSRDSPVPVNIASVKSEKTVES